MVKIINSWAQGIILAIIVATIIEIILPEGKNKKYIKTVIGIYVLFSIIHPIITKVSNKSININSIINSASKEIEKYEGSQVKILETNAYIEETYRKKVEEDITNKINEKGFNIDSFNLYIETENEDRYGQINSLVLNVSKNKEKNATTNSINEIKEININVSNTNKIDKVEEKVDKQEISELKEYLVNTYSIEKEKIHINE